MERFLRIIGVPNLSMSKEVNNLPASILRKLLIEEIQKFIIALDNESVERLQAAKIHLTDILNTLSEKEKRETVQIPWGKNASTPDPAFFMPAIASASVHAPAIKAASTTKDSSPAQVASNSPVSASHVASPTSAAPIASVANPIAPPDEPLAPVA